VPRPRSDCRRARIPYVRRYLPQSVHPRLGDGQPRVRVTRRRHGAW
jgi:hypothetical protein